MLQLGITPNVYVYNAMMACIRAEALAEVICCIFSFSYSFARSCAAFFGEILPGEKFCQAMLLTESFHVAHGEFSRGTGGSGSGWCRGHLGS
jgi:hypothetical protein